MEWKRWKVFRKQGYWLSGETLRYFEESQLEKYYHQIIHMGNPAEDLVRVFLCTLSGADRQAHWEKLLEQFYEYFLEALEDNEIPYTLDQVRINLTNSRLTYFWFQLKESYRLYFVTGSLVMLPLYGPIAQVQLKKTTWSFLQESFFRQNYHTQRIPNMSRNIVKSWLKKLKNFLKIWSIGIFTAEIWQDAKKKILWLINLWFNMYEIDINAYLEIPDLVSSNKIEHAEDCSKNNNFLFCSNVIIFRCSSFWFITMFGQRTGRMRIIKWYSVRVLWFFDFFFVIHP